MIMVGIMPWLSSIGPPTDLFIRLFSSVFLRNKSMLPAFDVASWSFLLWPCVKKVV